VHVVEPHEPGLAAGAYGADHGCDTLEQPHLRAWPAEWGRVGREGAQPCELGQEQRRIRELLRRDEIRPAVLLGPDGGAQQLDDGSVRQPGLVVVAACRQHGRPCGRRPVG
jgi:hypothetical protein